MPADRRAWPVLADQRVDECRAHDAESIGDALLQRGQERRHRPRGKRLAVVVCIVGIDVAVGVEMNDPPARDVLLEARLAKRKRCDRGQQRRLFGARQKLRSVDEAMGQPRRQLEKLALASLGRRKSRRGVTASRCSREISGALRLAHQAGLPHEYDMPARALGNIDAVLLAHAVPVGDDRIVSGRQSHEEKRSR